MSPTLTRLKKQGPWVGPAKCIVFISDTSDFILKDSKKAKVPRYAPSSHPNIKKTLRILSFFFLFFSFFSFLYLFSFLFFSFWKFLVTLAASHCLFVPESIPWHHLLFSKLIYSLDNF